MVQSHELVRQFFFFEGWLDNLVVRDLVCSDVLILQLLQGFF